MLEWVATPVQERFLRAVEDEVLFGGAVGPGKTDGLLMGGILRCTMVGGAHVLYLRRTYPDLEMSAIKRSHQLLAGSVHWHGGARRWTWPNGSRLQFGHVMDDNAVYMYKSAEFDLILFDELTQFTEFQYTYMMTRNRTTKDCRSLMRAASNPDGPGVSWVKRRFVEVAPPNTRYTDENGGTRIFIPARLDDNPHLLKADPKYLSRLQSLPEVMRRALLEGDWNVFEGQYFKEFRVSKHVIEPFEIPDHWPRFASIDWGYAVPCCILWHTVTPDRRVITYREYYEKGRRAAEVAGTYLDMTAQEDVYYVKGSPDMWAERGLGSRVAPGETIAEEFVKRWVPMDPADNRRILGWNRVREYLADAPDGMPWWQVFSTCTNLIRTFPVMMHSKRRVEDIDDVCEDHALEALRYALMSRPSVQEVGGDVLGSGGRPGYDDWPDEDDDDERMGVRDARFF